jgi:hypothetical protein
LALAICLSILAFSIDTNWAILSLTGLSENGTTFSNSPVINEPSWDSESRKDPPSAVLLRARRSTSIEMKQEAEEEMKQEAEEELPEKEVPAWHQMPSVGRFLRSKKAKLYIFSVMPNYNDRFKEFFERVKIVEANQYMSDYSQKSL